MAIQTVFSVGDLVRTSMADKSISQYKAARSLNLSQAAISRRLSGDVEFSISELTAIAALLEVPIGDLLPIPPVPTSPEVVGAGGISISGGAK